MADVDLDRAEQLAAAATPGPWWADEDAVVCRSNGQAVLTRDRPLDEYRADAEFIAAARDLVPALVARVRQLTDAGNTLAAVFNRSSSTAFDFSRPNRAGMAIAAWRALVDTAPTPNMAPGTPERCSPVTEPEKQRTVSPPTRQGSQTNPAHSVQEPAEEVR